MQATKAEAGQASKTETVRHDLVKAIYWRLSRSVFREYRERGGEPKLSESAQLRDRVRDEVLRLIRDLLDPADAVCLDAEIWSVVEELIRTEREQAAT